MKVSLSSAAGVLESANWLRTALIRAAVRGGLDYPLTSDPKARLLLREPVKATRAGRHALTKVAPVIYPGATAEDEARVVPGRTRWNGPCG